MIRRLSLIIIIAVLCAGPPAGALECVDWSETMLPPTVIEGVQTGQVISAGEWLVVAGETLQVCDVSEPAAPVVIGTCALPEAPGRVRNLDGVVYLACGASGLLVADLADPEAPAVRTVFVPDGCVVDVTLIGDVAVVVTAELMLHVLTGIEGDDVSIIASAVADHELYCIESLGDVALVGTLYGLLPVDLADPAAPVLGEHINPIVDENFYGYLPITDMAIDGTTVYVACYYYNPRPFGFFARRVCELDASDAMHPEIVACEPGTNGYLVAFADHLAIVGLGRLDIVHTDGFGTDARFPLHEDPVSITRQGSVDLYIAGEERLFHADVTIRLCVQSHATAEHGEEVYHGNRYRYVGVNTSYDDGTNVHEYWIYDMAGEPDLLLDGDMSCYDCDLGQHIAKSLAVNEHYVMLGYRYYEDRIALHDRVRDRTTNLQRSILAINDDYLWAGYQWGPEVFVYDIGGPYNPVEIGRFTAPNRDLTRSAVHDDDLMVCYSTDQLWAVAIGDNAPVTLSLVDRENASGTRQIEIHDGQLFIAGYHEFRIWDYTTPTAPVCLGALPCPFTPKWFTADADLLVVADDAGFQVYQGGPGALPQPMSPVIIYPHDSLTLSGRHLFVADDEGNLILHDLTDPATPVIVGVAHGPSAEKPYVDGDRIYSGYSVFPPHCGMTPIDEPDEPGDPDLPAVAAVALHAPVPNPFNPRTTVAFDLVRREHAAISVHDMRGRRLATLTDEQYAAGRHEITWHGADDRGRGLPSGTYLIRLVTDSAIRTTKAVLIR